MLKQLERHFTSRGWYAGTHTFMSIRLEGGFAIDLFLGKYEKSLTEIFKSKAYRNSLAFICFAELHGSKSEFGQHEFKDDIFDITLFDVSEYKRGFIPPRQFIRDFGHTGIPNIIYEGNLNREFIQQVKTNKFSLKEGVVCKGLVSNKKTDNLYYCKIKTNQWFDRLHERFPQQFEVELKQLNKNDDN